MLRLHQDLKQFHKTNTIDVFWAHAWLEMALENTSNVFRDTTGVRDEVNALKHIGQWARHKVAHICPLPKKGYFAHDSLRH